MRNDDDNDDNVGYKRRRWCRQLVKLSFKYDEEINIGCRVQYNMRTIDYILTHCNHKMTGQKSDSIVVE